MPIIIYGKLVDKIPELADNKDCTVCLMEFEKTDKIRMTVCYHVFHSECLLDWLKKNANCPFCRLDIFCLKKNIL